MTIGLPIPSLRDTRITGERRTESTEARKSEISGSTDGFDIGPDPTASSPFSVVV
jgi:hypothetical protein